MRIVFFLAPAFIFGLILLRSLRLSRRAFVISAALLACGLAVRGLHYNYISDDYNRFLSQWIQHMAESGGFLALREPVGDYNIPYLYILAAISYFDSFRMEAVKSVSVLFDVLLAFAAYKIVFKTTASQIRALVCFFVMFFLPTVFLNSGCWAQCDSIYVSLILLGVYFCLDDRPNLAVAMIALAFSFKLQTIFIMPMVIPLLAAGKLKLRNILVFFPVFFGTMVPALLLGLPISGMLSAYLEQAGEYSGYLYLNAPNFFAIFDGIGQYDQMFALGIIFSAGMTALICFHTFAQRETLNNRTLILTAFLICLLLPWLLPKMHERYFYLADAFAVILACCSLKFLYAPILVQAASFSGYYAYLRLQYLYPMRMGGIIFFAALAISAVFFVLETRSKNLTKT